MSTIPDLGARMDTAQSLREQVASTLRALIVSGQLAAGELYSAPGLAARFGVSATPVREAMLDLAGEGLVEPVRNKGFRVTEVSDAELDAMAELRALIEIPVMARVARECTDQVATAVEQLRPLATEMVGAADVGDLGRYIILDTRFHLEFLALHGNPYVVDVVRDMRGRSRLYGLRILAERGTLGQNAADHLQMVDAALRRDETEMTRLMTVHIDSIRDVWAGRPPARDA